MSRRAHLICLWCLPLGLAFVTVGWIATGYFPPPNPAMSLRGFQSFFIDHASGIRVGVTLLAIGGMLTGPFTAAVTVAMLRIEGRRGVLGYTQLVMGAITIVTFMVPLFPLAAAAYRPHSDPALLRVLSDLWWLPTVMAVWPSAGQALAMGALALRRTARNPLPRWFGYACVACAVGMMPSAFILSHLRGPLGSRGVAGLWVTAVSIYTWYVLTMIVFHRAIASDLTGDADAAGAANDTVVPALPAASAV